MIVDWHIIGIWLLYAIPTGLSGANASRLIVSRYRTPPRHLRAVVNAVMTLPYRALLSLFAANGTVTWMGPQGWIGMQASWFVIYLIIQTGDIFQPQYTTR